MAYIVEDEGLGEDIYYTAKYKLSSSPDNIIYPSRYFSTKRCDLNQAQYAPYEDIKQAIINMYKFNIKYNTSFYEEDIAFLKTKLDKHDLEILEIDLKKQLEGTRYG